jgi:hypothetical protein
VVGLWGDPETGKSVTLGGVDLKTFTTQLSDNGGGSCRDYAARSAPIDVPGRLRYWLASIAAGGCSGDSRSTLPWSSRNGGY